MSSDLVRRKMGGDGISSVTRNFDKQETSAADYPGPYLDVYVEYDRRINLGKPARATLVRSSTRLVPTIAAALVDRFGVPDVGAENILNDLNEGVAVWVDESCGLVLTAYRPRESWWKAEGRTTLQLETLDLARKGDSPASSSLTAILERKQAAPAAAPRSTALPTVSGIPPQGVTLFANSVQLDDPLSAVTATVAPVAAPATPPDKPAERITFVEPLYPRTARWLKLTGHVTLAIVVQANGIVAKHPRVVAEIPLGSGFAEAAIEAVQSWRFTPAIRKGKPVKSSLTIDVEFDALKN